MRASALIATAALLAGCGGGASTTPPGSPGHSTHGAFVAKVDAVCAKAVARHAGHEFPVSGFDPEHPSSADLPAVGDYFAKYGGLPATTRELHTLKPPAGDADAWARLLQIADKMAANAQRQIDAARTRDVATFVDTVRTANGLIDQVNAAGSGFGFAGSSPCQQVFG